MKPDSLLSNEKLAVIKELAESVRHSPGDAAEFGVYRGGSAHLIASTLPDKKVFLFDTFQGMPFHDDQDVHKAGEFSDTSLGYVQEALRDLKNVHIAPGVFPGETGHLVALHSFCFVHVDADQYRSTIDAIRFFYPRMVAGGIIVFDDYDWRNCPGVKVAVDEFFSQRNEKLISKADYQVYISKCL